MFRTKLLNDLFDVKDDKTWFKTVYYYMIDSQYRVKMRVDNFLKKQIVDPDLELVHLSKQFAHLYPDQMIIQILKFVTDNITYKRDQSNFGKTEYWAGAGETWRKRADDCFPYDEKIIVKCKKTNLIQNISFKELKNKYKEFMALSYDFNLKKPVFKKIINFIDKGKRKTNIVQLRNGSFRCTNDHKFMIQQNVLNSFKWQSLKDVSFNKNKYYARNILSLTGFDEGSKNISKEVCNLIGAYIADGWSSPSKICIAGDNPKITRQLHVDLNTLGISFSQSKRKTHAYTTILLQKTPKKYINILKKLGRIGAHKRFPSFIMDCDNHTIKNILYYYGQRDGTHKDGKVTVYSTVSDELAKQLKLLLRRIGVHYSHYIQHNQYKDAHRLPIHRIEIKDKLKSYKNNTEKNSIQTIVPYMYEDVCDITVEDTHNFILSNGIIAHNCDGINALIYVLARLAGMPEYLLYSCIGSVKEGGHYWNVYISPKTGKVYPIDGTYYINHSQIKSRLPFEFSNTKYKSIWFIFNENFTGTLR